MLPTPNATVGLRIAGFDSFSSILTVVILGKFTAYYGRRAMQY